MIFENREAAARLLAEKLEKYRGRNPLILGIPRGAMPMARILAEELKGDLGAVLVRKIPAPDNDEFAIGSVGLSGHIYRSPYVDMFHITDQYLESVAAKQLKLLRDRQRSYGIPEPNYRDRVAIIVDDGIATGATTQAAVHEVRAQNPKKLVLAAAVASPRALAELESLVDELVVLHAPELFFAVSQFFVNFAQVSDEEVAEIFRAFGNKERAKSA